ATTSSVVGRLSDGSIVLNVGSPPVPGPTRATTGPTPCAVHLETSAVGANGSPTASVSNVSRSTARRYPATYVTQEGGRRFHRRATRGRTLCHEMPFMAPSASPLTPS